jgi:AraC-like DNA-binding protein
MFFDESIYLGSNVSIISRSHNQIVYQLLDATGKGTMTAYSVFSGVSLFYQDFHMEHCFSEFLPQSEMLCIDHCREGRLEWEMDANTCMYMEAGDLQINSRTHHTRLFRLPLKHYHGITVAIQMAEAIASLPDVIKDFPVDLMNLKDKFCAREGLFLMRAGPGIDHIFSELYQVPEKIRPAYFKIKVLELLLFLTTLEISENTSERPYFHKSQVKKTKAIMKLLTDQPEIHYTLAELSKRFDFPLTAMKNCFKGVYGTSIYAYMKSYRMNQAAIMLRTTSNSVTTIALSLGYENTSKFAAAFKSVMGITPLTYRKTAG